MILLVCMTVPDGVVELGTEAIVPHSLWNTGLDWYEAVAP